MKEYKYFKRNDHLCRIHVEQDEIPWNPREDCDGNIGHIYIWSRYAAGDSENNFDSPYEFLTHTIERYNSDLDTSEMTLFAITEWLVKNAEMCFLPVFLLQHSVTHVSTDDFCDRWDSGQVGYIWTDKATVLSHCGNAIEAKWKEVARKDMKAEIKQYDMYLNGECCWRCKTCKN